MTLIERRAKFVYNAARITAEAAEAPIIPVPWTENTWSILDMAFDFMIDNTGILVKKAIEFLRKEGT